MKKPSKCAQTGVPTGIHPTIDEIGAIRDLSCRLNIEISNLHWLMIRRSCEQRSGTLRNPTKGMGPKKVRKRRSV